MAVDPLLRNFKVSCLSKRAVTYFARSLAKESRDLTGGKVQVRGLTPGIMITDFITHANGGATIVELSEKTKRIYNILGDYSQTIADYVADSPDTIALREPFPRLEPRALPWRNRRRVVVAVVAHLHVEKGLCGHFGQASGKVFGIGKLVCDGAPVREAGEPLGGLSLGSIQTPKPFLGGLRAGRT